MVMEMLSKKPQKQNNKPVEIVRESALPVSSSSQDTIVEVRRRIEKVHEEYFSDRKAIFPSEKKVIDKCEHIY